MGMVRTEPRGTCVPVCQDGVDNRWGAYVATAIHSPSSSRAIFDRYTPMRALAAGDVSYVATDVGLWMSLPAFGPAFVVAGVVMYVIRRDRRRNPEARDGLEESHGERKDAE